MISRTTIILGVATCLSVAAGMFAPDIMCDVQSRIDTEGTETFATKQIAFEPADHGSVLPAIRLLREADMTYEMESGTNLTPDEAIAAAVDASQRIAANGFGVSLENRISDATASPFLYVSQASSISGIIWTCECVLDDGESTASLCVDDSTGKAITYSVTAYRGLDEFMRSDIKGLSSESMRSWIALWGEYWGEGLSIDALGSNISDAELDSERTDGASAQTVVELFVSQEKLKRESKGENVDISVAEAVAPNALDLETSDDPRTIEKLASKLLADEDGLEELRTFYDGLSTEVLAKFDEDPRLQLLAEWMIGVVTDSVYEVWTMTPM